MHVKTKQIRDFLLNEIGKEPVGAVGRVASNFGISRQAVQYHVAKLVKAGLVRSTGRTRGARLQLVRNSERAFFSLAAIDEDQVWRQFVQPKLQTLPRNVFDICQYGLTEMVNNAIDHSAGTTLTIGVELNALDATIRVIDDGVGIFRKIQEAFQLEEERHALLELTKGKLTTDPARHSGEGIFFTSRVFDQYSILAGNFFFCHLTSGRDWLVEDRDHTEGTNVTMKISRTSSRRLQEVFDYHTAVPDDFGFSKTVIPVKLAQFGEENLISRSQAKRLLNRVERFKEVVLDFSGVEVLGQAFADEIFRVYATSHPEVRLHAINENPSVKRMINRALHSDDKPAKD
ncbi:MAG TPA: DUF4325 domain-containing protein [Thermoanaerobaculia bacterium]|nr:DUF4325 domain-containing protein [Thermoanaerobaculia bacterium]